MRKRSPAQGGATPVADRDESCGAWPGFSHCCQATAHSHCSEQRLLQESSGLCAEAGRAHAAARLARGLSQFLTSSALSLMDNGTTDDACRAEARRIFRQYVLACRASVKIYDVARGLHWPACSAPLRHSHTRLTPRRSCLSSHAAMARTLRGPDARPMCSHSSL